MDIPVTPNLRSSVFWSSVRNWGVRLGSVAVFVVLARILPPAELGLFASAAAIIALAEIFAENGVSDAVVQRKKVDVRLLSTALWINLILALLMCSALWAAAPAIERALAAPGLAVVLVPVAFGVVLNSMSYVPQAVMRRNFKFRWLGIRALIATGVSGIIGIAMALAGFGVLSLIVQFIVMGVLNAILVWRGADWRPQLTVDMNDAISLSKFGAKIFFGKILSFISGRSIELIIASCFGPAILAIFLMGNRINAVLMQMLSAVTIDVSLANFSRLGAESVEFTEAFYRTAQISAVAIMPFFALLSALAPELTWIAYGSNGAGSDVVLSKVSLLSAIESIQFLCGTAIIAIGRPGISTLILAIKALLSLIVLLVPNYETINEMVSAYVLTMALISPISFFTLSYVTKINLVYTLKICIPFILAALVSYTAIYFARTSLAEAVPAALSKLAILGAIGTLTYLAAAAIFDYRGLKTVIKSFQGNVKGKINNGER